MELDEIASLRAEFKALGWNRKATGRIVFELAIHFAISIAGYVMFLRAGPWWFRALGMAVSTYGTLGVATNTHTSTHNGTSDRKWVNDLLSYVGYPLFLQLSLTYWRNAHVVVHHPAPNVMGVDDDADFSPFFASTDREIAASTGLRRLYFRHQWLFFPLVVWVHVFLRQRASWHYLVGALLDRKRRRKAHWIDLGCMVGHWALCVGVPFAFFPLRVCLAAFALRTALLGYPLFCVLAPGHYPADASCVARGDWAKDFLLLQTSTTLNFRTGFLGRFICSGLDYQIEHHLFPGYSHVYYRRMSVRVKQFCETHGYPYRMLGWPEAVWKTFMIFRRPKVVVADLQSLRNAPVETNTTANAA